MSILNDDTEVEDAMQASYIKAYEHLAPHLENRSLFSTWITRIMINECLLQKKKINIDCRQSSENQYEKNQSYENARTIRLWNKELGAVFRKCDCPATGKI